MKFENIKTQLRSRKFWLSWLLITLGAFILAAGFVLFTNPYKIVPGGVYGLGRVLHHLVPSIQTGTFGLLMDIPLMITGLIVFGSAFGIKTVYAALITPLFMNTLTSWIGESPTDGVSIISRYFDLSDNVLVAAIFGGVLIGAGVGLIIKSGATSGGTDIIAMLMVKVARMKFSTALFLIEAAIILIGMFILQDWKLPLFSLIAIFVQTKVVDFVLEGASSDKLLFIVTDRIDEMRDFIINDIERSSTLIKSKGMYTDKEREMIFLVVSRRQITAVQDKIKEIDPHSFVVVVNAFETYGDGFKSFDGGSM